MAKEDWMKNVGQWKDPEKAAAAARKGHKVRRAKKEFRQMVENMDELRTDAIANMLEDNPDLFGHLMGVVTEQAMQGERWAIEMLIGQSGNTGFAAPKKTETKVKEEPMSAEEAAKIIAQANLKAVGDK